MNIFLSFKTALLLKELGVGQGSSKFVYMASPETNRPHYLFPSRRQEGVYEGVIFIDAFTTQEIAMAFDPKEPDFLELELLDQLSETNKKLMYDTRAFWDVEFVAELVIANIKNATLKISEINDRLIEGKLIESL